MIKIWHTSEGRTAPVIVCDVCGEMILNADHGAAVFDCKAELNAKTDLVHAHKGPCHDMAEKRFEDPGWDELALHILRIGINSDVDFGKEAKREKALRDEGL